MMLIHAVIDLSQSMIIMVICQRELDRHIKHWSVTPRRAIEMCKVP